MSLDESKKQMLRERFEKMDHDKSGFLDREEIAKGFKDLGMSYPADKLAELISKADKNADGRIQFDEFIDMM
jgi:Ca2+-binding EF-hand superfamily protein